MSNILLYIIDIMVLYIVSSKCDYCCEHWGVKFRSGEHIEPPGECMRLICDYDGYIHMYGCPLIANPCNKYIVDYSRPYPDCCILTDVCTPKDPCTPVKEPKDDGCSTQVEELTDCGDVDDAWDDVDDNCDIKAPGSCNKKTPTETGCENKNDGNDGKIPIQNDHQGNGKIVDDGNCCDIRAPGCCKKKPPTQTGGKCCNGGKNPIQIDHHGNAKPVSPLLPLREFAKR